MGRKSKYDVFLSYSRSDADTVTAMAEELRKLGFTVWFDKEALVPGAAWRHSIEEAITKAGSIAVFVGASGLSPWQQAEVRDFLPPAPTSLPSPRVVPILLPGAEPKLLPPFVQSLPSVDMRKGVSEDAMARLVNTIEGHPAKNETSQEEEISDILRTASAERRTGNYSGALSHLKQALEIKLAGGGVQGQLSTIYNNLGIVLRDQGKLAEAMTYFQRALALDEKVLVSDDPALATRLNNIGSVLRDQGKLAEAMTYFQRALALDEKSLGSDNPAVATRLNNLASVLRDQGKLDEASTYLRRALSIGETALGPDHPEVANLLSNLGGVLRDQGNSKEASVFFQRALTIGEKVLGPDHPMVANFLSNLGGVLRDQGRSQEAAVLFRRALAIDERALGPDHPTVANRLSNLGSVLRDQGELEEAAALFHRALAIDEKALGRDHPSAATVLNNLAGVYAQRKVGDEDANLRAAIGLLERAQATFERAGSAFQAGQTLTNLAVAYSRLGGGTSRDNVRRALSYCDQALRVFEQISLSSESDPIVELQRMRKDLVARLAEPA
jgi:tetratricopeptide (TPR) repeat protein